MSHHYDLYDAVEKIPVDTWQALCRPGHDVFMDLRFLRLFEQTAPGNVQCYYVLVRDAMGEPAGAACFSLCELDAALLCQDYVARRITRIRRLWPRYLRFRALFCGLPFSAGQSHVRLAPNAEPAAVIDALHAAAISVARRNRSWLVIFKEFVAEDAVLPHLRRLGYVCGHSLPMNCADTRFRSLDEFCASLRSHYRYKMKRSMRKFQKAGMRVEHLQGPAILDAYTDEVHRLYDAVVDAAAVRLERLPARFFRELVRALPEYVGLTAVRHQDRIVAFAWRLFADGVYHDLFVGIDYNLEIDCDLYFNLMACDLDMAFQAGTREIQMGQTADTFKSRLGCHQEARYVGVKTLPFWLRLPFRAAARWIFPLPSPLPARDLFRDTGPKAISASTERE